MVCNNKLILRAYENNVYNSKTQVFDFISHLGVLINEPDRSNFAFRICIKQSVFT